MELNMFKCATCGVSVPAFLCFRSGDGVVCQNCAEEQGSSSCGSCDNCYGPGCKNFK